VISTHTQGLIGLVVIGSAIAAFFAFHSDSRAAVRRFYWTDKRIQRSLLQKFPAAYRAHLQPFLARDPEGNLVLADQLLDSEIGRYVRRIVEQITPFQEYHNLGTADERDENVNLHNREVCTRTLEILERFIRASRSAPAPVAWR